MRGLVAVVMMFVLMGSPATCKVIEVAMADDGGNDAPTCGVTGGSGPCATVSYAVWRAVNGDVIQLGAGTFLDALVSSNKRVVIRGESPSSTVLGCTQPRLLELTGTANFTLMELAVSNCSTLTANLGTMYANGSAVIQLLSVSVSNCASSIGGGVVAVQQNAVFFASYSVFTKNSALAGGMLYASDAATATLYHCQLSQNGELVRGSVGGAIRAIGASQITVIASTLDQSSAYQYGGTFSLSGAPTLTVRDSAITNSIVSDGMGMHLFARGAATVVLENTLFQDSTCLIGDCISSFTFMLTSTVNSSLTITKCVFSQLFQQSTTPLQTFLVQPNAGVPTSFPVGIPTMRLDVQQSTFASSERNHFNFLATAFSGQIVGSSFTNARALKAQQCPISNLQIIGATQSYSALTSGGFLMVANGRKSVANIVLQTVSLTGVGATGAPGGAILIAGPSSKLTASAISVAQAQMGANYGGFIAVLNGARATITGSSLSGSAGSGGVAWIGPLALSDGYLDSVDEYDGAYLAMSSCSIVGATASTAGGALTVAPGQVLIAPRATLLVSGVSFLGTSAGLDASAGVDAIAPGTGGVADLGPGSQSTFTNCFMNSTVAYAGGVLHAYGTAKVTASNLRVQFSKATMTGGFAHVEDSAKLTFTKSSVSDGTAREGAAMYVQDAAAANVTLSSFKRLTAHVAAVLSLVQQGSMYMDRCSIASSISTSSGGSFSLTTSTAASVVDLTLRNTKIYNSISTSGSGGGIYMTVEASASLQNVTFVNCQAMVGTGGAMYLDASTTLTMQTVVMAQGAAFGGGGFFCTAEVRACVNGYCNSSSAGMQSTVTGNQIQFLQNRANAGGAIIAAGVSQVSLSYAAFVGNTANVTSDVGRGGALYVDAEANVALLHATASNNVAKTEGGFAYVNAFSFLVLQQSTITGSSALMFGGFAFVAGQSLVQAVDSTFSHNRAYTGGLVSTDVSGAVVFTRCFIYSNVATNSGGVVQLEFMSSAKFSHCTIYSNSASFGGVASMRDVATLNISSSVVFQNQAIGNPSTSLAAAGNGGVVLADNGADATIIDSVLYNNVAAVHGGALAHLGDAAISVQNGTFIGNSAKFNGGAVYVYSAGNAVFAPTASVFRSNKAAYGGGIFYGNSTDPVCPKLSKVKFLANVAVEAGGGIYFDSADLAMLRCPTSGCVGCWVTASPNVAGGYGPNYASAARSIQTTSKKLQTVPGRAAPKFKVWVQDLYGQTIRVVQTRLVVQASTFANDSTALVAGISVATLDPRSPDALHFNSTIIEAPQLRTVPVLLRIVFPQALNTFAVMHFQTQACPPGYSWAAGECVLCAAGTVWNANVSDPTVPPVAAFCQPCGDHTKCTGGTNFTVERGFWHFPNRFTAISCLDDAACAGFDPDAPGDVTPSQCTHGYSSTLCFKCAPGFARSGQAACSKCPENANMNAFVLFVIAFAQTLFMAFQIYTTRKSAGAKKESYAILLKVLASYTQFVSLASGLQVDWPNALSGLFRAQSSTTTQGSLRWGNLDCILTSQQQQVGGVFFTTVTIYLITPLAAAVAIILYWIVAYQWAIMRAAKAGSPRPPRQEYVDAVIVSCIVMGFNLHPAVSQQVLNLFSCRTLPNDGGIERLVSDLDYMCWTAQHDRWLTAAGIPGLLFYVIGIPLGALVVLWRSRHKLYSPEVQNKIGFLYLGYNPRRYFWEVVIMLRKVAVIAIIAVLSRYGTLLQVLVALGVVFLSFRVHLIAAPYSVDEVPAAPADATPQELEVAKAKHADDVKIGKVADDLERASLVTTLLTFFFGYFLNASANTNATGSAILLALIFLVNVAFLLLFARSFLLEVRRKATEVVQTIAAVTEQRAIEKGKATAVKLNLRRMKEAEDDDDE